MLFVVLSALMVTLASAQFPFAPHYPAYPGNYYRPFQHQYQDNRGIVQSITNALIPSAFVKTTTVNSTVTVSVTCTVSAAGACGARLRRDADEVIEQFAPSQVVPVQATALPVIERDARQAYPYASPFSYQGYPYGFHQQAVQSAYDEPNTYQVPYIPSFAEQQDQVAERQFYLRTTTKTSIVPAFTTISVTPTCFDSKAKLFQCPAA